ncbi:hypothetical protein GC722_02680 [Auraticoccus sp. F435]|uniref:Uncharacterized protein n=1 Tax=Auraticoccus cholistanensis TaxID=2656650 RepID=A0A6A9UQT8_9ACTN|nr:hypothetical protein [Auraticoccus cholistanensis]MVA74938.1 hypothetical protein [Auraticoccus cholistanensis]
MPTPAASRRRRYVSAGAEVASLGLLLVLITGCTVVDGVPGSRVGSMVARWSVPQVAQAELQAVVPPGPGEVLSPARRDELLARLPEAGLSADPSAFQGRLLVAHGYSRCGDELLHRDWRGKELWFAVAREDEGLACAVSPYTVEIWAVEPGDLRASADEVRVREARDR